jgi:hypothetical protein
LYSKREYFLKIFFSYNLFKNKTFKTQGMELLFFLGLPGFIVLINFIGLLFTGKYVINKYILRITEFVSLIILPFLYTLSHGNKLLCCGDSAIFSPDHVLSILVLIAFSLIAYFYSSYRSKIAPPLLEVITNMFLSIGIVLNVFIAIHTEEIWFAIAGNLPIILLAILALVKNHRLFIDYSKEIDFKPSSTIENYVWKVLNAQPILKFPIILVLSLPIVILLIAILLLFGQKPDSLVRAFTDTYKHGFSEWNAKCDNIECGDHYLCSVAANGHTPIVKPQRIGIRNGHYIICNRQLLISNAFEDLIQEEFPSLHIVIRKNYNKVGDLVHKYYDVFNIKLVSDFVYILMKPLEWFFLLTLYTFDRKPENRIAKQYISHNDRLQMDILLNAK